MPNHSDNPQRIEIVTGHEQGRRYSAEFKLTLVEQTIQPGMTLSAVARQHGVSPSLLFNWRRLMTEGGQVAVKADEVVVAASRARELEQRVRELERLLGRKTLEVEFLKEALAAARGKKPVWQLPSLPPAGSLKVVADTIGVARSNLVEQLAGRSRPRGRYARQGDDELLAAIRQLTDARPSYGYRRITALLNRARGTAGLPLVNHKRVFRLMERGRLLLQPHVGHRLIRAHEGSVIAETSNQRWSSDSLEIACWNGEVVRVVFAIDICDREIIAWLATTAGVSGEMVRDLMLACVERRFSSSRAPHPVQWLADNGPAFTARETIEFAAALLLVPCFTPVRSPESNGISEAFVKTLKRDYARIQPRPDALTVLQHLPAWIDDYNDNHPHSGLRMRSPREFIRSLSQPATCPI